MICFNKPYGVLSQFTPEGRWRGLKDFIDIPHVYAAGRLDADSEGLLLLTDDGQAQARIADPRFKMEKTYWVQVDGVPDEVALGALRQGVLLKDGPTLPARARTIDPRPVGPRPAHPRAPKQTHRLAGAVYQRRPQPPGAAHDSSRGPAYAAANSRCYWSLRARRAVAGVLAGCGLRVGGRQVLGSASRCVKLLETESPSSRLT